MAKIDKTKKINAEDINDYLESYSDFAFELKVLKFMNDQGFSCEHAGLYHDPNTNKTREFDIRATKIFGKRFLRFAIECKNLAEHYPLLIMCCPRRAEESFNEVIYSVNRDKINLLQTSGPYSRSMLPTSICVKLSGQYSLYKAGEPVGKSCVQIGRAADNHNNEFITGDTEVFNKWSQAVTSANELAYLAHTDGEDRTGDMALSLVIPIVVVPDEMLWIVKYDSVGNKISEPRQVNRCSYYVNVTEIKPPFPVGNPVTLSHIEFLNVTGLSEFINDLGSDGNENNLMRTFPEGWIEDLIEDKLSRG